MSAVAPRSREQVEEGEHVTGPVRDGCPKAGGGQPGGVPVDEGDQAMPTTTPDRRDTRLDPTGCVRPTPHRRPEPAPWPRPRAQGLRRTADGQVPVSATSAVVDVQAGHDGGVAVEAVTAQ